MRRQAGGRGAQVLCVGMRGRRPPEWGSPPTAGQLHRPRERSLAPQPKHDSTAEARHLTEIMIKSFAHSLVSGSFQDAVFDLVVCSDDFKVIFLLINPRQVIWLTDGKSRKVPVVKILIIDFLHINKPASTLFPANVSGGLEIILRFFDA